MPTSPAPYSVLPIGAGDPYLAPVAVPQNCMFLSPRDFDFATLSASTAVPSLPVSNLQNQEPSKVWRTTSALGQYVDIVLRSALACDAVAMSAFNMSSAGIWRLKAYASADDIGGTAAFDSGWQSVWPGGERHSDPDWGPEVALLLVANDSAYRYWRLEFSDLSVATAHLDIGRLAIGRAARFSINADFGDGLGFAPNDTQEPNGWGQIFTEPRPSSRIFEMQWSALAQREVHDAAMELTRLRGLGGDVFYFRDPGEIELFHKWSVQALFGGRADYKSMPLWTTDSDGQLRMAWGFSLSLIQKR